MGNDKSTQRKKMVSVIQRTAQWYVYNIKGTQTGSTISDNGFAKLAPT